MGWCSQFRPKSTPYPAAVDVLEPRRRELRRDPRGLAEDRVGDEPGGARAERDAPRAVAGGQEQTLRGERAEQRAAVGAGGARAGADRGGVGAGQLGDEARAALEQRGRELGGVRLLGQERRAEGGDAPAGDDAEQRTGDAAGGLQALDAGLLDRVARRVAEAELDVDAPRRHDRPPGAGGVDERGAPRARGDDDRAGGLLPLPRADSYGAVALDRRRSGNAFADLRAGLAGAGGEGPGGRGGRD